VPPHTCQLLLTWNCILTECADIVDCNIVVVIAELQLMSLSVMHSAVNSQDGRIYI